MKDIMVLINGDIEELRDRIYNVRVESWKRVEDHYDTVLTSFIERISKFKILAQMVRQPS